MNVPIILVNLLGHLIVCAGEITKARACEKEAIDNNKTVIATLSHDIKTPIASIRAYAEGLEANLDTSIEKGINILLF